MIDDPDSNVSLKIASLGSTSEAFEGRAFLPTKGREKDVKSRLVSSAWLEGPDLVSFSLSFQTWSRPVERHLFAFKIWSQPETRGLEWPFGDPFTSQVLGSVI